MTVAIALLFAMLLGAMLAFAFDWLPVDVVTLVVLSLLVATGILTPSEAFSGLASEVIIVLACIFVLSGALTRARVLDGLGRVIARAGGSSQPRAVLCLTSLCAAVSAFVNNTNATAVLMPAAFELSRKARLSASRLLMPLAFASILGGTCTLIGTSTNIAASGLLVRLGLEPFELFDLTPVGVPLAALGVLWLSAVGFRLLPDTGVPELAERYEISHYLAALSIDEGSPLVGKSVQEVELAQHGLNLLSIERQGEKIFPQPELRLEAGDLAVVHGSRDAIVAASAAPGLTLEAGIGEARTLGGRDTRLMESLVLPQSVLVGHTLTQVRFRQRFGVAVLAVHRHDHLAADDIRALPLRVGDVLLLQGPIERLRVLQENRDVWLLGALEHGPERARKGTITLVALVGGVLVGALGLLPLSIAMLVATLSVVLLRVVPAEEVYALIEWRLLVLIGGMSSIGLAMQKTGGAELLASWVVGAAQPFGVPFVLAAFGLLAMVLTQPLSNAAAALVLLPIAVSTAEQLDANPHSFAAMVTLAASLSFITPLEPSCLLVYGPGRYRFADFVRTGGLLSVVTLVVLMVLVPIVWPP